MANSTTHSAIPYPIKNARYATLVPFLDADGDPLDPTTPDTEISKDAGSFADCVEEVATITGSNGVGYITLGGAETDCSMIALAFKVASGPKATLMTLYPRALAIVGSGTLSAGSAGGGTLGTILSYDVCGCFIRTTGGTGGGGTGGVNNQARKIITYTPSTGAFTVVPNWETTPSTDTTYDVLLPEGLTLGALRTLNPTTAGRTLDVSTGGEAGVDWANVGSPTTTVALTGTTAGLVDDAITAAKIAANAIGSSELADGAITAAKLATDAITAAKVAADVTTEITSGLATATNVTTAQNNILAVLGALADAAADGDPTSADTVMMYVKQLVNVLVGTTGVVTFPASATPANAVSLAEVIRQIYDETAGLNGGALLDAAGVRTAVGLGSANLDTQLGDLPTNAELATALAAADDAVLAAIPSAATVADAVWDEAMSGHTTSGTYGQRLQAIRTATAQAGAAGTITLDASASATDDFYNKNIIVITAGTGANQARYIDDYTGSSKVAAIAPNWVSNPSSDSVFMILPDTAAFVAAIAAGAITAASIAADAITDAKVASDVTIASVTGAVGSVTGAVGSVTGSVGGNVTGSVGSVATGGIAAASFAAGAINAAAIASDAITAAKIATGAIDADALATDAVTEIAAGISIPSAATIADAVWDEDATGHQTQGSFGQAIGDPVADADTIWGLANTNLNATVGSRASQASLDTVDGIVDAILVDTTEIGAAGAGLADIPWNADWDAEVQSEVADGLAAYDPPTHAELISEVNAAQADIAAVQAVVDAILVDTGTTLQAELDGIQADTEDIQAKIGTPAGVSVSADIAAIEAQTDDIGAAGAGLTAVPWNAAWDAEVQSEATDALNAYDPPTRAEATSDKAEILAKVQGFVLESGTIGATGNDTTHLHIPTFTYGNDEINNYLLVVYDASEDEYHARYVEDWVVASKLATVATLPFTPEASVDGFFLLPFRQDVSGGSGLDAAGVRAAVGLASANLDTQIGDLPTNAELATALGTADDAVLAAVAGVQSDTNDIQTRLPAALVGGRIDATIDATGLESGALALINAEVDTALADYDAPTSAELVTEINSVQTDVAAVQTSVNDIPTNAELATALGTADDAVLAQVALVKAKTDNLPSDPADQSAVESAISAAQTAILARVPAALVGGRMDSNASAIAGDSTAATNLGRSALGIVRGAAIAGTLSTTQMTTDLTETTNDHYNGRVIVWTSGALAGQATDITDYDGTTKRLTYTAVTEAPTATDQFVIV